jgi:hypothetical protein
MYLQKLPDDTQMIRRNFWSLRVPGSALRQQKQTQEAEVRKICRERKLHGGMHRDQDTGGPVDHVGYCVFITFFYCPRLEMSLWCKCFLGRSVSLGKYIDFDNTSSTSCVASGKSFVDFLTCNYGFFKVLL